MTDPIVSEVEKAASATESTVAADAKAAVTAQVAKQKGWIRANWKALVIGLAVGLIVGHFL